MNKLFAVLKYIGATFVGVVGLVFAFIEIRPIFAGDWKLMEIPAISFIEYLLRAIFFLFMFINALKVFMCVMHQRGLSLSAIVFNGALIAASAITFIFYEWYISLILVVLNSLMLVIRVFIKEKLEQEKDPE